MKKSDSSLGYFKEFKNEGYEVAEDFFYYQEFFTELAVLYGCNHKNVIRPLSFSINSPSIIIEYGGRDLFSRIMAGEETIQYFSQLVEGLKYLHSVGIIHCDVKPSNCVIENGVLKIIDFGISALSWRERTGYEGYKGTHNYMDPMVVENPRKYDPEYDMWSCGCVLIMMLQRRPAFWNENLGFYEETMTFVRETIEEENPFPLVQHCELKEQALGLLSLDRTQRAQYFY